MPSPVTIVAHLDGFVQRRFDHLVHAVMRRTGASKRVMRRGGWAIVVYALAIQMGISAWRDSTATMAEIGICLFLYNWTLVTDDREDERAERSNMLSLIDERATWRKTAGLIMGACCLLAPFAVWVLLALVWLYQGYLCRTSPQVPPPQKEREPKRVLVSCAEVA